MPRLFTALEVPAEIGAALAGMRGGLPGARWIDPANYHVTLRFIGDVDRDVAEDVYAALGDAYEAGPRGGFAGGVEVAFEALAAFGGDRPRALIARARAGDALVALQAEQERIVRRVGLAPERRRFTPHVTLARLSREADPGTVAGYLAEQGRFPPLAYRAARFVLYSARDSVGGGPYLVEAAFPLAPGGADDAT